MRNKSKETRILEEKIIELRGRKINVALVEVKLKHGYIQKPYANFLKNNNFKKELKDKDVSDFTLRKMNTEEETTLSKVFQFEEGYEKGKQETLKEVKEIIDKEPVYPNYQK